VLPLKDDNPTRRFPVLTVGLIVLNVLVFAYQSTRPVADLPQGVLTPQEVAAFNDSRDGLLCEFGLIPDRVLDGQAPANDVCVARNLDEARITGILTHQFLHADLLHLLGNMLFLWVFGNNVEDRLGRIRYLPFFVLCGVIAALGQALTDPSSTAPLIGASGAISGVLGAYLVLFPHARVLSLVGIIPLRLPAWLVLGVYLLFQFLYAGGEAQEGGGGVAYWAHIVGFVAGLVLITPFLTGRRTGRPPPRFSQ
jgi:membrane associated rhomboid family serine protease